MKDTLLPEREGSENLTEANSIEQDQGASSYKPDVHAPRPIWFELFLGLITWNVYFCFWSVGRARDLKTMRSNGYQPWLWFFAPLTAISLLIAFARMFSELQHIEGERLHRNWHRFGWLWLLLVFVTGMLVVASEFGLVADWVFWVSGLTDLGLFALVHQRFNTLKKHDAHLLKFHGRAAWFYWWEWVLIAVALAIWAFLAYLFWEEEQGVVEEVGAGYIYQSEDIGYRFSVDGKQWRQVKAGTYSNGSALVEFGNKADTAYLIVFKHNIDETLNSVANYRYRDMQGDFESKPTCTETRVLSEDEKSVTSTTTCLSEKPLDGNVSVSKLIELDGRLYELLGWASSQKVSYQETKRVVLKAAETFSAIRDETEKEQ